MTSAFIFPGQGSQKVGMGKDLYDNFSAARHVFQEVDEALSFHLSKLMFEGQESELNLTQNAQPALMAVSMAAMKTLESETGETLPDFCGFVAGHSLGEYSALCAAGAFDVATAARLLKIRGEAMQAAVPVGQGAMAALLGIEFEQAVEIAGQAQEQAGQGEICVAANDNAPGQVVISGTTKAIERACEMATAAGAKRALLLPVSVPAHSPLLQLAADQMEAALSDVDIQIPSVPVIANITAAEVMEPTQIKSLLVQQVTGTVRWRESMQALSEKGVTQLVEIGAGKVLCGLAKRIDRALGTTNIEDTASLEVFLSSQSSRAA